VVKINSRNPYTRSVPGTDLYSSSTTGSEPNMRQEIINMFDGAFPEVAKAQDGLLRKMRRDSNGNRITCACVDPVTKEPDKDQWCPLCEGEGFYWDEEELQFYCHIAGRDVTNAMRETLARPGLIDVPIVIFYIRYESLITKDDRVVRLVLENDGSAVQPRVRRDIFGLGLVWDYRADNAKLEYWKGYGYQMITKHLNPPAYGDY
jgi:hypothetical protein